MMRCGGRQLAPLFGRRFDVSTLAKRYASWDWREGQMCMGKIIAMKGKQLMLHEHGTRSSEAVPCMAVEPPRISASREGLHK